jgi:hypothetical protein
MEEYLQLAETLQTAIDEAFSKMMIIKLHSAHLCISNIYIRTNCLGGWMQKLLAHASEHHPKLLARVEKGYLNYYQRFVK